MKQKLSILMVPVMAFYTLLPCVSQAVSISSPFLNKTQLVHSVQQNTMPPTGTITYFYNGSTLMNAEDDNGDMSTYLDRTVRTIVSVNTQTVEDTQSLFTDGKNVISQTDSTGTNITSTQQYNAFGQPVSYTSSTNKQINKLTNQQLNILTNPFQYDGYYLDSESGLYYLNARYYSPTLMQFISMDSYDLANRYAYSDGNPIGNEDPTGHNAVLNFFGINTDNDEDIITSGSTALLGLIMFGAEKETLSLLVNVLTYAQAGMSNYNFEGGAKKYLTIASDVFSFAPVGVGAVKTGTHFWKGIEGEGNRSLNITDLKKSIETLDNDNSIYAVVRKKNDIHAYGLNITKKDDNLIVHRIDIGAQTPGSASGKSLIPFNNKYQATIKEIGNFDIQKGLSNRHLYYSREYSNGETINSIVTNFNAKHKWTGYHILGNNCKAGQIELIKNLKVESDNNISILSEG